MFYLSFIKFDCNNFKSISFVFGQCQIKTLWHTCWTFVFMATTSLFPSLEKRAPSFSTMKNKCLQKIYINIYFNWDFCPWTFAHSVCKSGLEEVTFIFTVASVCKAWAVCVFNTAVSSCSHQYVDPKTDMTPNAYFFMLMCWGLHSMSQTRVCPILKGCQYHSISSVSSKTSFF